jgi:hypothetical protein
MWQTYYSTRWWAAARRPQVQGRAPQLRASDKRNVRRARSRRAGQQVDPTQRTVDTPRTDVARGDSTRTGLAAVCTDQIKKYGKYGTKPYQELLAATIVPADHTLVGPIERDASLAPSGIVTGGLPPRSPRTPPYTALPALPALAKKH